MIDDRNIFIRAILAADSLPLAVRESATAVESLEWTTFDASYLDFLREQIRLAARGPEWTAILTDRLAALSPYCDKPTLRGAITTEAGSHSIRVDPESGVVIHHEFNEAAPGDPS